jgi:hypothetical protein
MSDERKLNFIKYGQVPIKHTGIAHDDFQLKPHIRERENNIFTCSVCDSEIKPNDSLHTHTLRGHLIERKRPDFLGKPMPPEFPWEVLGFICGKCWDESAEYDSLYYG